MDKNFQHSFGFLTHDVARLLGRNFEEKSRRLGMTLAQTRVLAYASLYPGIKQVGLADCLEVQPISLARLLDRMEAACWVERRPDPDDRRAKRVYLTEKANCILEKLRATALENNSEALAGLSAEQRDALLKMMLHIHTNLSRLTKAACQPHAG